MSELNLYQDYSVPIGAAELVKKYVYLYTQDEILYQGEIDGTQAEG